MSIHDQPVVVIVRQETPVTVTREVTPVTVVRDEQPRVEQTVVVPPPVIIAECPVIPPAPFDFPSVPPIQFSYGDAPSVVWLTPVDGAFTITRVDITEAFNLPATISVGVVGDADALMRTIDNAPQFEAGYEVAADYPVTAGTGLWLEITPSPGTTQGAGVLYVTFVPED